MVERRASSLSSLRWAPASRRAIDRVTFERLEERRLFAATVPPTVTTAEPIGGAGNNVANPTWGTPGTDLTRLAGVGYADGIDSPSLPNDRSARAISNVLNSQTDPSDPSDDYATIDQNSLSDFGYAFGQFLDHDMDHTPDGGAADDIAVAAGDPIGPGALPFTRSITDPATGKGKGNPAQQISGVSSYLDLSQVYGSTQAVADALRTFSGGLLKTSAGNMLPYDNTTYFTPAQIAALNMENDSYAVPTSQLFAAGDTRANENLELTTLETLFVRNHNLIASALAATHPAWNDEQLYLQARKLNIAEYQNVVYNGWIPAVLGQNALGAYAGYNPNVNTTIANEFSTVAFRFGHSMVSPTIARDGNNGQAVADEVPLADDFSDPYLLNTTGATDPLTGLASTDIGPVLKGEADGNGQQVDLMAVSPIRDLLFGNGGDGGQDLIALDIQRGRDNGIPSYNALRIAMGLPAVTGFAQITSNAAAQNELKQAYPGGVNTIDAFEGGLAEDHVAGSDVGPLFQAIMVNQFSRLRSGDRFFFQNESFTSEEQGYLSKAATLADIIESNTNITNLQPDAFHFKASISGTVAFSVTSGPISLLNPPVGNVKVMLEDMDGDVLASTVTNLLGQYTFNQLSTPGVLEAYNPGVSAVGDYKVVLSLPSGMKQMSANPATVDITNGNTNVTGVNFGVGLTGAAAALPLSVVPVTTSAISSLQSLFVKLLG